MATNKLRYIKRNSYIPNVETTTDLYNWTNGSLSFFAKVMNDNSKKVNAYIKANSKLVLINGVLMFVVLHDLRVANHNIHVLKTKIEKLEETKKEE